MAEPRFCTSPVDYEAWRNGYAPPSEHILIDALHRGDAKVVVATGLDGLRWWLVLENGETPIQPELIRELIGVDMDTFISSIRALKTKGTQGTSGDGI